VILQAIFHYNQASGEKVHIMDKKIFSKLFPVIFYALLAVAIGAIGYLGISRRANWPPTQIVETATASAPEVMALVNCPESTEPICVNSTGYDVEGNLLINLRVKLLPLPDLYLRVSDEQREIFFDCQAVDAAPRVVYCLGPFTAQNSLTTIEVYKQDGNSLLATGELRLDGSMSPLEAATEIPAPTAETIFVTETPAIANPSYPSYPSYPYP